MIDIILTSCGRFDLLERTLDSFFKFNTYPVGKFIVYDDSDTIKGLQDLSGKYPDIEFHFGDKRIGQIEALCYLMRHVTTPYYFSIEDDWEFYRPGFIEDSIALMDKHPEVMQCWLREHDDTNGHPIIKYNDSISYMSTKYEWKGFSFNPGVRRLVDYVPYNTLTTFHPNDPSRSEREIGNYYHSLGKIAAILPHGYVRHIGGGRTCI